jgi:protein TonB
MKLFVGIFLFFVTFQSLAQNDTIITEDDEFEIIEDVSDPDLSDDKTFLYVKKMPKFPGGQLALRRYIAEHIIYPYEARENGIQGTIYLRFEILKDGSIGRIQIQKGVNEILDKEAVRVIRSLPDFIPGEQNNKKVKVWYSLPVTFKLG